MSPLYRARLLCKKHPLREVGAASMCFRFAVSCAAMHACAAVHDPTFSNGRRGAIQARTLTCVWIAHPKRTNRERLMNPPEVCDGRPFPFPVPVLAITSVPRGACNISYGCPPNKYYPPEHKLFFFFTFFFLSRQFFFSSRRPLL